MWIFKKNEGIPGIEPSRYKARLVARELTQKKGCGFVNFVRYGA